jgi:hypothetical protein
VSAVAWWGYGITLTVLLVILVGMFVIVRAMSDDSGRFGEVKEMMEAMFHTPSFLRPGNGEAGSGSRNSQEEMAAARTVHDPFEDQCPACLERVTHEHKECPSCGLRLLD